ncbi:activating signal cointegrator 1 complex subunit 2 isoform X2 [Orussus abietinus]|uniref:activating signal cointegrator 1 complex subunit 2 isoform X2 n=1 Tax=Orussus abietinus TaxID=222816 RepID=UPI0006254ED3|nr:activating signal cointegrator 1 complex subunit 2 isoform X2 [Orussus abietinus]
MTENVSEASMDTYENLELKPLEQLTIKVKTEGVTQQVPALSEHWVVERRYLQYVVPKIKDANGMEIVGAKEYWLELVEFITLDLKWLLGLPFYKFWSNVVYNSKIVNMLVSFLQEAPPFYVLDDFPDNKEMRQALDVLRRFVLVTFARLVTNKESTTEFMTREHHGHLLYDNYIFTIPIMLDLCQLYGRENSKIVERILKSVFKLQPLYNDDLRRTIPFLVDVLRNIEQRFEDRPVPLAGEVVSLAERGCGSIDITLPVLEDLILHLLDISSNIAVFLENYPSASITFHSHDFLNKVVSVYSYTIPEMYKKLEHVAYKDETMGRYAEAKHRLDVTRVEFLQLYRTIIYKPIMDILEKSTLTEEEKKAYVDDYLNILTHALSEKEFIIDYQRYYPIDFDLEVLMQISSEVDAMKRDFILQSMYAISEEPIGGPRNVSPACAATAIRNEHNPVDECMPSTSDDSSNKPKSTKAGVELASLISEVKDILCNLGEGFIERCLKYYNYDSAAVVNAVLEDSLPAELKLIDRTLPSIPSDPMEASAAVDLAIGMQRLNVFDNDEFDIMTRDVIDTTRVHKGKRKEKHKNLNEMLNDKSFKKDVGDFYSKFSVIDDYDDEYDDTYDRHDVGLSGRDDPVEMDARLFTTSRGFSVTQQDSDSIDVKTLPNNGETAQNNKDHFIENPADVRARAEERRLSKRGGRGTQSKDTVGKPRGQGQDKTVLANREEKNIKKATRANHNRRAGAEWKRRGGMIPS